MALIEKSRVYTGDIYKLENNKEILLRECVILIKFSEYYVPIDEIVTSTDICKLDNQIPLNKGDKRYPPYKMETRPSCKNSNYVKNVKEKYYGEIGDVKLYDLKKKLDNAIYLNY